MSLLRNLADFAETKGKKLKNALRGLILQAANSPLFEGWAGKDKMTHVIDTVKAEFKETLQEFGHLAHDVVAIHAHATFAELRDISPDWLDPLVDKAEKKVVTLVDKVLPGRPKTPEPPGLGEFSSAAPKPTPAPTPKAHRATIPHSASPGSTP